MRRAAVLAALFASVSPANGFAQTLAGSDLGPSWWRVLGALAICVLVALLAAFALKALTTGGLRLPRAGSWRSTLRFHPRERRLRPIESVRLSPNLEVCLFQCDGREYLMAATASGVLLLREEEARPGGSPP